MPKQTRSAPSERIGAGKAIPMPAFKYQQFPGKSGGVSSDKQRDVPAKKIAALQNFVPAP
jgi:hypothetical protein